MKFAALTLLAAAPLAAFAEGDCGTTIFDIVKENSQFDTLQLALELTGLDDVLDGDGAFTVFAPTDKAFENLPSGVLDALVDNTNALTDILLYHVVSSKAFSDDLKDGQQIKTIVGRTVKVDIESDGNIEINDANVIDADIEACNGVIHVIDKVLIPSIKDVGDCDKHDKCGFCVGDCDSEHDCSDGRQCIKRSSHEFEDVPFCKGGSKDETSTDYCSWEI